jgi:hypothetical protein
MSWGIMMRIHIASIPAATVAAVFFSTAVFADPPAKLSSADIQSTFFTGQPFTAAASNVKYKMTFSADGKMKRQPVGAGSKGEGTWQLSKDGFCTTWSGAKSDAKNDPKPNCFTIVAAGDNKWSVLKGSTIMATWSK